MSKINKFQNFEGLYTLDQIMSELNITRQTALNLISRKKKEGYVSVSGGRGNIRIYKITKKKIRKGQGLFDVLNKYSKIKIRPSFEHKHYGSNYSIEQAIIDALKIDSVRIRMAALMLFKRIKNWSKLYNEAKKENLLNLLGAMYDMSRLIQRTPKMNHNTYSALLKNTKIKEKICKSSKEINIKWGVNLGFNKNDFI